MKGLLTKMISVILAAMLLLTVFPFAAAAAADVCIVAGSEEDIFGTRWDGSNTANKMTKGADGIYRKTYTVDCAYSGVMLKTVKNGSTWIGGKDGGNVVFDLTGAGTFTVLYDPVQNLTYVESGVAAEVTGLDYSAVYVAGNGSGAWLHGENWDPSAASNKMTQVEKDVWQIEFQNVPADTDCKMKFTIDGAWTHNFGGWFYRSGVKENADYDGDNIAFTTDDTCNVRARLDLSNFDYETKRGATFTITLTTVAQPGTTTAVTTAPPPTTVPAEDVYIVAGSEEDIFGSIWDGTDTANKMTKGADGICRKEYTVDCAYDAVQVQTVKNGTAWIGDKDGNNVTFALTGAGTFTVLYDPAQHITYVESSISQEITEFKYESVYAVGNGNDGWLNDVNWNPAAAENKMTEVAEDVWEISFTDVPESESLKIKFVTDGTWTHSFGGRFVGNDKISDSVYNGEDITFATDDRCSVTAQLDLSGFDYATKQGAKFNIYVSYDRYIAGGSEAAIFGTEMDRTNIANTLIRNEDGTYSRSYTVDKAYSAVKVRTFKGGDETCGMVTGNTVCFNLTGAGTFAVDYDSEKNYTQIRGDIVDGVKEFYCYRIAAVGNGEDNWLSDRLWDPMYNGMTQVAEDVWEIAFDGVSSDDAPRAVKFIINNDWDLNFGGTFEESGVSSAAVYNSRENISFYTREPGSVKLRLDLSGFDYVTKSGATFTITVGCSHTQTYVVEGTPATYTKEGLTDGVRCLICGEWVVEPQVIPKNPIDFTVGDLDGDGQVSINDATALQCFLAEYTELDLNDEKTFLQADFNGDGRVNVRDVTAVMRSLAV